MRKRPPILTTAVLLACGAASAWANGASSAIARIKDITQLEGVRGNHLFGYGLVVGLDDTGDSRTGYSQESIAALMRNMGVPVEAQAVRTRSVAAVLVTSVLPPFARPGGGIDVSISTVGDCKSLEGGMLMPTELRGYDGQTHAVAQGAITIGGRNPGRGGGGGDILLNHRTVAVIPNGAVVEGPPVETDILQGNVIRYLLHDPDFVTANRVKDAVNEAVRERAGGRDVATALNAGVVEVNVLPLVDAYDSLVELIAELEQLEIRTDEVARVVINERTGTVVMGHNVRISKAAVSHHDFIISFSRTEETVSPARPRSVPGGETTIITEEVELQEKDKPPFRVLDDTTTVKDLIDTLNALAVTPRDMIAILQALRSAGALKAEIVVL